MKKNKKLILKKEKIATLSQKEMAHVRGGDNPNGGTKTALETLWAVCYPSEWGPACETVTSFCEDETAPNGG